MLDFNNTEIAFSAKSQSELKNAYLLFNTIKYPWLVKCASVVSNIALNIHFPLGWAVKPTLYKQFVGGETLQDCTKAIDHLRKFNVRSTLDFSAEGEQTPEGIQATFEETIRSIDFAKGNDNLAYAVFTPYFGRCERKRIYCRCEIRTWRLYGSRACQGSCFRISRSDL